MSSDRPIRVFTDLKNSNKMATDFAVNQGQIITEKGIREAVRLSTLDRQINVTGVGELVLLPDRFSSQIKCHSTKDNILDAQNSVKRRADYIIQTLQNHGLKEADYQTYQHASHSDNMASVYYEVEAHFTDSKKCQDVANLLSEKLGPGVSVSLPQCYHARGTLDKLRRQSGMLAIHNAKQKALEMAKILHLSVGPVLQVQELGTTETHTNTSDQIETIDTNPSFQQRIADATVSVSSKVAVCFQLKPAKPKRI